MVEPMFIAMIGGALIVSAVVTGWVREFALSKKRLDMPNSRSSHALPTPRGGGAAIVLVVLSALPLLAWHGILTLDMLWGFMGAGGLVAAVGWLDDGGDVAAGWRLVTHLAAGSWAVAWVGGLPSIPVLATPIDLGWVGNGLTVLYLVWLLNLYNFMDGIDGIAGIEAVTVCLGGVVLYWFAPGTGDAWVLPMLLAACVCGFLLWNFPRARVFMGDTGSGFIGLLLGMLSLKAGAIAPELFWGWVILVGAFVVDATVTLIRRMMRGEAIYQAHRTHAYQRLARLLGSHVRVSLAFGIINVLWLLPIAIVVTIGWLDGALGVFFAYTVLVWLAVRLGAGRMEEDPDLFSLRYSDSDQRPREPKSGAVDLLPKK